MSTSSLSKVIAVLRAPEANRYRPVVHQLVASGIRHIELTLTTPGTIDVINLLRSDVGDTARIGVGTVTETKSARAALTAGAQFLVTPGIVEGAATLARENRVPIMMGALTPSEVMTAMAVGADLVKIFPASTVTTDYLNLLRAPFPGLRAVPSGGIGPDEARAWLTAGATAVSIGGSVLGHALHGGSLLELADRIRHLAEIIDEPVNS